MRRPLPEPVDREKTTLNIEPHLKAEVSVR